MDHGLVLGLLTVHSVLSVLLMNGCKKKVRARDKRSAYETPVHSTDSSTSTSRTYPYEAINGMKRSFEDPTPKHDVKRKPVVTKAPLRDLADESSLSRSKLQGSSELECEETSTAVKRLSRVTVPKRPAQPPKEEPAVVEPAEPQPLLAEDVTAQETSLRVARTPVESMTSMPIESEQVTTARPMSYTPVTPMGTELDVTAPATSPEPSRIRPGTGKLPEVEPKSAGPSEMGSDMPKELATKSAAPSEMGPDSAPPSLMK
uniref:Transmembrane protein n=2 Tax=Haemonchus contortus TaxID=6289 RepID=A0A7I4XSB6_HAECO